MFTVSTLPSAPVELREHNLQLFFTALVFLLMFLTISSLKEGGKKSHYTCLTFSF